MRKMILGLAALITLAGSPPGADARTAKEDTVECVNYCGDKAAEKCDDVTSTWCNAYIVGCLAGCGIAHL